MSTKPYNHVYLSPHLDDVIFSCGSAISKQHRIGDSILVITIFAGTPSDIDALPVSTKEFIKESGYSSVVDFCKARI